MKCFTVAVSLIAASILPGRIATACPFCNAVSQTLRQEMAVTDAVVIARSVGDPPPNEDTGEVSMRIQDVLKGDAHVRFDQTVTATYYGEVEPGRLFLLQGVDPPELLWSCLPLTPRSAAYVRRLFEVEGDDAARLRFVYEHLNDAETLLARDAYDEFALAPYETVRQIRDTIDRAQLLDWLDDPELTTDRRRLYYTLLGIVGGPEDLPRLERRLRSKQKSTRGGLDALIACYLTLAGESGLSTVEELFLTDPTTPYSDTHAAILALRFHGTEGDVIARSRLSESMALVLDRETMADIVIPDLARWERWDLIDKMVELFESAEKDDNWVRVPVVNYLRACPLPEADEAIERLKKVDPDSVRRAGTYFAIPVPARDVAAES